MRTTLLRQSALPLALHLSVLTVAAIAAAWAPLVDHLGYELAQWLTIVSVLSAPWLGAAEATRAHEGASTAATLTRASLRAVGSLAIPVTLLLLNGLRRPACTPWTGLQWVLLLAVPSAALAAAIGVLARRVAGRRRTAALLITTVLLTVLALGLWPLYDGPEVRFYSHLWGHVPGPLYDEAVAIESPLLWFRLGSLEWWLLLLAAARLLDSTPGWRRRTMTVGLCLAVALLIHPALGIAGGYRSTDGSVRDALGASRLEGPVELIHPAEWDAARVTRTMQEVRFRHAQLTQALGIDPAATVRVWMHRSAGEKRRLVGAAHTAFAKPWRREVHIHDAGGGPAVHPVLRHELVHVLAAPLAPGPFGVAGGWLPATVLIEGLAVALDTDPEPLTLEASAAALRRLGLAPDLKRLLRPGAFFASAPARAYTYAGALLRHIARQHGETALRQLYADGHLDALGPLDALLARFEAELDAMPLSPEALTAAQRRFRRGSIVERRCAREASLALDEAVSLRRRGRLVQAQDKLDEACRLQPNDPEQEWLRFQLALRRDGTEPPAPVVARFFETTRASPGLQARGWLELGDRRWLRDDHAGARDAFEKARAAPLEPATLRAIEARIAALDAGQDEPFRTLLAEERNDGPVLAALQRRWSQAPDDLLAAYLLGRHLLQQGDATAAVEPLRAAQAIAPPELHREAAILLTRALATAGRCDEAESIAAQQRPPAGMADDSDDVIGLCRFHSQHAH